MRTFNIHRQKPLSTKMKTIEELHAEAAVNMQILRATQFNAKCLRLCWLLLLATAIICSLI